MTKKTFIVVLLACAAADFAGAAEPLTAKVLGHRVNLRAKADLNSEVVGQVSDTDVLQVKSVQDLWVEVRPPESIDLWINRDLVTDDKIAVNKANVRAGPGINYTVVGTLARGDAVTIKGTFGEWVRIAPFDGASLWVNKDLLDLNLPLSPASAEQAAAPVMVAPSSIEATSDEMPVPQPAASAASATGKEKAPGLDLIPLDGQGQTVQREGILKPAPYLFSRPAPFRLARREGSAYVTVCFLRGNNAQLEELRDVRLRVKGRQYWTQGSREPVLVVESIQKLRDR